MKDYTDITILLDRSGSMEDIREGTLEGLNAFVSEQKKVPGDGSWSLFLFDVPQSYNFYGGKSITLPTEEFPKVVYEAKPQEEMRPLTKAEFVPRGGTALIDAACLAIDRVGQRLARLPESERPDKIVFAIMTDGLENASNQFSREDLNRRITHQTNEYKWNFVFLGANQDAIKEAASYGIGPCNAMNYTATNEGAGAVYRAMSAGVSNMKSGGTFSVK